MIILRCVLAALPWCAGLGAQHPAGGIHYRVTADDAGGVDGVIHLGVEIRVAEPGGGRIVFAIPVWTPGSYRLRPFPERIHDVTARDAGGRDLAVRRLDRDAWEVAHESPPALTLAYRVELHENDRFMLRGNRRRCITYEGPAVYMYVRGRLREPHEVEFAIPADWSVASGLEPLAGRRFRADDYDVLADCPVKLGSFQRFSFDSHGRTIDVVVDGPGDVEFDHSAWLQNIARVTDAAGAMFGGFPFPRYVFLFTASPEGSGGGLEHLTSTCIGVRTRTLRSDPQAAIGTTAHEFFHAWNVKRLRPVELGPFDYSRPNRTDYLWLAEGVTSYYTQVLLARAGLIEPDAFWQRMFAAIRSFEGMPGRTRTSSAKASREVWDPQPEDARLNYYTSGQVLGLLLDLEIRGRTGNRRSLDDVMRGLFELCRERGAGFRGGEVAAAVTAASGTDMTWFFDAHVAGVVVPDYAAILGRAGIAVESTASSSGHVRGLSRSGGRWYWVDPERLVAGRPDLTQGAVIAVDGAPIEAADLRALIDARQPGERLTLTLAGLAGERRQTVTVAEHVDRRLQMRLVEDPPAAAAAIRAAITAAPR